MTNRPRKLSAPFVTIHVLSADPREKIFWTADRRMEILG